MRRILTFVLSGVAILSLHDTSRAEWGTLTGQFILDGEVAAPAKVQVTKDQQVCGKFDLVDEKIKVNPENNGVEGVVIYLYLKRGSKAPTPHPDYANEANAAITLDNLNCRFEPHIVLLRTSQTLVVGNKDPVGHNTKIDAIKNVPVNPIIPAGAAQNFSFPKEERLPTKVSCSIHPWMFAYVVIKDSPYMAVSDKDGNFTIKNLPTGKWTFQAWQEAGGYVDSVNLGGKKTKWARGRFQQTIKAGDNDLGEIKVTPAVFN